MGRGQESQTQGGVWREAPHPTRAPPQLYPASPPKPRDRDPGSIPGTGRGDVAKPEQGGSKAGGTCWWQSRGIGSGWAVGKGPLHGDRGGPRATARRLLSAHLPQPGAVRDVPGGTETPSPAPRRRAGPRRQNPPGLHFSPLSRHGISAARVITVTTDIIFQNGPCYPCTGGNAMAKLGRHRSGCGASPGGAGVRGTTGGERGLLPGRCCGCTQQKTVPGGGPVLVTPALLPCPAHVAGDVQRE